MVWTMGQHCTLLSLTNSYSWLAHRSLNLQGVQSTNTPQLPNLLAPGKDLQWADTWTNLLPRRPQECHLHSKIQWFTEFCNSHYVSQFAAFFINVQAIVNIFKQHTTQPKLSKFKWLKINKSKGEELSPRHGGRAQWMMSPDLSTTPECTQAPHVDGPSAPPPTTSAR